MVEFWKLKRELRRFGAQIRHSPDWVIGPFQGLHYALTRKTRVQIHKGHIQPTAKVALFLIYQPHGVARSVYVTCRHLIDQGYCVLLVSNSVLSDVDRSALVELSWRVVERPNFGYDFGGYREGIALLEHWKNTPDDLIILNDSIWFPVSSDGPNGSSLIARLEHINAPASGLLRNIQSKHDNPAAQEPAGFVESYFYHFSGQGLRTSVFARFWRKLRLSNVKRNTIKRGEKGFSEYLNRGGLPLAALASRRLFLQDMRKRPVGFLEKTLQYSAYVDADLEQECSDLLAAPLRDDHWKVMVQDHIETTVYRTRFNAAFPFAAEHVFGLSFLKKHKDPLFIEMRRQYLNAVIAGDLPEPASEILDEIAAFDDPVSRQMVP